MILGKLRGHFEERFRYDETGVPRVWKPEDDIDGAFKKAKDEVCDLTYATASPSSFVYRHSTLYHYTQKSNPRTPHSSTRSQPTRSLFLATRYRAKTLTLRRR